MSATDPSQESMHDLFRQEAQNQVLTLSNGLLALERGADAAAHLEACMRAAHSMKGAARIVGIPAVTQVAHAMEDCFVSAQSGRLSLDGSHIDLLLRGADMIARAASAPPGGVAIPKTDVDSFLSALAESMGDERHGQAQPQAQQPQERVVRTVDESAQAIAGGDIMDRGLRVTAENLNRLLSLSGESLVESRRFKSFAGSMLRLKRLQRASGQSLDKLHGELMTFGWGERSQSALTEVRMLLDQSQHMLAERFIELENIDRRSLNLSQRLYDQALACRMRPFSDCTPAYPRMVRDLGRSLGKRVRLEIIGEDTRVDRDILETLDAPLGHILRNAVDHGIESPARRRAAGKPEEGVIMLEAQHRAGMLQISVSDDGAGVDLDRLRAETVRRGLVNAGTAAQLSETELLDFLLLPSFTMRDAVTEISGRGVGLDAVHSMIKHVRGMVRIVNRPDSGMRFELQLPLTLSVIRSLLVTIDGEAYAFPLAFVNRTLELRKEQIEMLQGHQHFAFDGRQIGLVSARQLLGRGEYAAGGHAIPVVVIGSHGSTYGLAVDNFLGECLLVVQALDSRLGKIKDIAASALTEDGTPVLIVDVDDMIRSVEKLIATGRLDRVQPRVATDETPRGKRILVVDDSLTVRELERKILSNRGYQVEVAIDGVNAWNALRTEPFDLVITDIDMPRMDGIELVTLIRKTPNLASMPVMIVSYKDREQDRQRGLDAGADYFFAKGSFRDADLLQAVQDVIGEAHA